MKLPSPVNSAIDIGGVLVALIVDIVLNVICFSVLAPDSLTRIAFIAISVMIVLFVFRSWSKRQFVAWAIFALVVFFFDYSFTLESTRTQAQVQGIDITQDVELTRIQGNIDRVDESLNRWMSEYEKSVTSETLREIDARITIEEEKRDKYEAEYKNRMTELEKTDKVEISSANIFNAIPNAIKDGRFIQLVIWGLIFIGVQLIVVSSIDNKNPAPARRHKPAKRITPDITRQEVEKWVKWNWIRVSQGESNMITSRDIFFDLASKQNISYDAKKYDYLIKRAKARGVIDKHGHALIVDEIQAVNAIIGE